MRNENLDKLNSLITEALAVEAEPPVAATPAPAKENRRATLDTKEFWDSIKRVDKFQFSPECSFARSSELGEKFDDLRANLQSLQVEAGVKTVAFSAAHPNEGTTCTAVNAARFMAENKARRTLLVDCNLRNPHLKNHITTRCDFYLEDFLSGNCKASDAIVYSEADNLAATLTRHAQSGAEEMLKSPATRQFIAAARQAFDFVLIDTPPVLSATDASLLGAMCDGAVLVIKAGATSRESVEHAISLLRQANANVLGVVLSQV